VPRTVAAALLVGVAASIALGVTAGPLADLFTAAAGDVGSLP
jgi:hydrogenase-4 component F